VSGVLLLRPDAGPSIPRVVKRAIGATIAAALVVGFVMVAGDRPAALAAATVVAALVFFAVKDTSYALFVAFLSVFVVLLPCQMGANPVQLAEDRWLDLVVGGVLSVIVMLIIPIWNTGRLPTDISAFVQASSVWFNALGDAAAKESTERGEDSLAQCRGLGSHARRAGTAAWATMRAASVEPGRRGVRLVTAAELMNMVGAVNEFGVMVEGRLGSTWSVPAQVPGSLAATAVALQAADQTLDDAILEFSVSGAGAGAGAEPSQPTDRDSCGRHVAEALADARSAALASEPSSAD
ncbi:MAG: FUSC family protein, partial [Actinomycetes bacterium]